MKSKYSYDVLLRGQNELLSMLLFLCFILYPLGGLYVFFPRLKLYIVAMGLFCLGMTYVLIRRRLILKLYNLLKSNPKRNKTEKFLLINIFFYIGWAIISIVWSIDKYSTIIGLLKLLVILYFSFCTVIYLRYNNGKVISLSIFVSILLTFIIKLYKVIAIFGMNNFLRIISEKQVQSGNSAYSMFIHTVFATPPLSNSQNVTDSLIVSYMGILILIIMISSKKLFGERLLNFLVTTALIFGSLQLYIGISKTAILCLFFLLCLLFFLYYIFRDKSVLITAAIIFLVNMLVLAINPFNIRAAVFERFSVLNPVKEKGSTTIEDISISSRIELWKEAIEIFKHHKLIGIGYKGGQKFYLRKFRVDNPHNIFIQTLSELGIIGLIFLSGVLVNLILIVLQMGRQNKFLTLNIGLILIYFFRGLNGWQFDELDIWLLIALVFYTSKKSLKLVNKL